MYESPIELIIGDYIKDVANKIIEERDNKIENEICYTINTKYGINIDKEELMRALAYDRDQYAKGYYDARRELQSMVDFYIKVKEAYKKCDVNDLDYIENASNLYNEIKKLAEEYGWDDDGSD